MAIQSFLSNRPSAATNRGGAAEPSSLGGFQRLFEGGPQAERDGGKPHLDAPQIEVIEENGRVASIVVTCKCCERIEIECRY